MPTTRDINEAYRRLDGQYIPIDSPEGSVEQQLADQAVASIHTAVKWAKQACELRDRRKIREGDRYWLNDVGEMAWEICLGDEVVETIPKAADDDNRGEALARVDELNDWLRYGRKAGQ